MKKPLFIVLIFVMLVSFSFFTARPVQVIQREFQSSDDIEAASIEENSVNYFEQDHFTRNSDEKAVSKQVVTESLNDDFLWDKTYGGSQNDSFKEIIQTSDGGYALAGTTASYGVEGTDFWLVKTDENGNINWNKTYGNSWEDELATVIQTSDGGYALFGITMPVMIDYEFWMVKTDANGVEEWNCSYGSISNGWFGGATNEICRSAIQTTDGGFAMIGSTESSLYLLVKISPSGNLEWYRSYGIHSDYHLNEGRAIIQTEDEGYIVAGTSEIIGPELNEFVIFKTSANGTEEWSQHYGGSGNEYLMDCIPTMDGGFALVGKTDSFSTDNDMWIVKTDTNGNMEWSETYGSNQDEAANSIIQLQNGNYVLIGILSPYDARDWDAWIVETNYVGMKIRNTTIGGSEDDLVNSIILDPNGNYLICGETYSAGDSSGDAWLFKLAGNYSYNNLQVDLIHTLSDYNSRITNVDFGPDSKYLAASAGLAEPEIRIWDVSTGSVFTNLFGHSDTAYCVSYSPCGNLIASGGLFDNRVKIWNISTGLVKYDFPLVGIVERVIFSSDGEMIAACSDYETIKIWNVSTGGLIQELHYPMGIKDIAFNPDGSVLAAAYFDPMSSAAVLWDVSTGEVIRSIPQNFEVLDVSFSPNGQYLAFASGSILKIYDSYGNTLIFSYDLMYTWIFSLSFSADSQVIATGSDDNLTRLWDVTTGEPFYAITGHSGPIWSVDFAPNGILLATGSDDQTIRIWKISSPYLTVDTDNDGMPDFWEEQMGLNATDPGDAALDLDSDGMPNLWEYQNDLNATHAEDSNTDKDGDGLTNLQEYLFGSLANKIDSDLDGMDDHYEYLMGLDPVLNDSALDKDNDGLSNILEFQFGSLANQIDTDLDGIGDLYEYLMNLDPLLDDSALDKDSDGLTNLQEYTFGSWANQTDTDLDGMDDHYEYLMGLDPLLDDGSLDKDADGLPNLWEHQMDLNAADATDAAGDKDADGLPNLWEYQMGFNAADAADAAGDKDGDGMSNLWEYQMGLNAADALDAIFDLDQDGLINIDEYLHGTVPANPDSDNDGLTDGDEVHIHGTDPMNSDTDGDGLTDGDEVISGSDPLVSNTSAVIFTSSGFLLLLTLLSLATLVKVMKKRNSGS